MARTFLGPVPAGCVPYHKNGCQTENHINNIAYIAKTELGRMTGHKSRSRVVAKIDAIGTIVEFYPSARKAAKQNYMSYQTVIDRCSGKCKSPFAPDGYAYAWDEEKSLCDAIRKIEAYNGYMPKAPAIEFDF